MALLHTVRGDSGSGSLEEVTEIVPDVWLIPCQRIDVERWQRQADR